MTTTHQLTRLIEVVHTDPVIWSHALHKRRRLRAYQSSVALAVADSILNERGLTIVATFSRQAGKDELLAQLIAYLLSKQRYKGGWVVVGLPAIKSQGAIALRRLTAALKTLITTDAHTAGSTITLDNAGCTVLSAAPGAASRGATASLLLVANEAQDIDPDLWDARFAPMAVSTNATRLIMGTVWSASGLLHREMTIAADAEKHDGIQRLFVVPWRVVAAVVPSYGRYVENEASRLGWNHPFIRTEYELKPLSGDGGLFPHDRQALLRGAYPALEHPAQDETYAATLDVAGESEDQVEGEEQRRANPRKDSTALSIHRVIAAPRRTERHYQLVCRYEWLGTPHDQLHDKVGGLLDHWRIAHTIIDATGVGAGLASFLAKRQGKDHVTKFVFSSKSKSDLGWAYVGMIDSGRATVHADPTEVGALDLSRRFWRQIAATSYVLLPGPGKLMRWSVPDPTVHDDLVISAALVALLDDANLSDRTARGGPVVLTKGRDWMLVPPRRNR